MAGCCCLHLVELVLFAAAFLCGAVVAVELTWTQGSFNGDCPLYGVAVRNGSSLVLCPSAPSVCHFVAGTSGLLALFCLLLLLVWAYCCYTQKFYRSSVWLSISLAISSFLILVCACILRFGTISLCNSIVSLKLTMSCSEAQKIPWTPRGSTVQFYSNLHNAEMSSWVNLVLCMVLMLQVMKCSMCERASSYEPLDSSSPMACSLPEPDQWSLPEEH
uniref:transmembrane protein 179B n=1 Tax=Jaculus jaculus TaxID=51337 RepID=UPI001E1B5F48|nr:transmembrane protein 179B [Jaculus jaculus]